MNKIKVLVYITSLTGVDLHRLFLPYLECQKQLEGCEDMEIQVGLGHCTSKQEVIDKMLTYDIVIYHAPLDKDILSQIKGKVITVCDVDDYWVLSPSHPLYNTYQRLNLSDMIKETIENSDYITTTTNTLFFKIFKTNRNVVVFPNALNRVGQFEPQKQSSKRIRFGLICGTSHVPDLKLLDLVVANLPLKILNQIQFVLCGFDKGETTLLDDNGNEVDKIQTPWEQNIWTKWEKMLTNDYKTVSSEHLQFLKTYDLENVYNDPDEPYKRRGTLPIQSYAYHYDNIDILLAPLVDNEFNRYKSNLKVVEAAMKDVAIIASDNPPYSADSISYLLINGRVNKNGNCILVRERNTPEKNAREWIKAITFCVEHPEAVKQMKQNNYEFVNTNYNLTAVSYKRINWLKKIYKDNEKKDINNKK